MSTKQTRITPSTSDLQQQSTMDNNQSTSTSAGHEQKTTEQPEQWEGRLKLSHSN